MREESTFVECSCGCASIVFALEKSVHRRTASRHRSEECASSFHFLFHFSDDRVRSEHDRLEVVHQSFVQYLGIVQTLEQNLFQSECSFSFDGSDTRICPRCGDEQARVAQEYPVGNIEREIFQKVPTSSTDCRPVLEKVGDIGAEVFGDPPQRATIERTMPERRQVKKHRGRISTAATQARTNRNALVQVDVHTAIALKLVAQQSSSAPTDIRVIERNALGIRCDADGGRRGEYQLVCECDAMENRFDSVITIWSPFEHA